MRIGYGYDVHRLKEGRPCILCGVAIPSSFGPDGYSDADVAVHALMDALLGAAALGDIGAHFPDNAAKWKDADSLLLLKHVYELVLKQGYTLANADITIALERPKLLGHILKMRETVAAAISVDVDKISVKATTEEGMGYIGSGEGVSASAVVLIE